MIIYVSPEMVPLVGAEFISIEGRPQPESTGGFTYAEIDLVDTTGHKRAFGCFPHGKGSDVYWMIEPWFAGDPKRKEVSE